MDVKARLKKRSVTYLCVLAAGVAYYIWVRITGIGIPCIFHEITGWSCPGCGVTTLIMSAAAGRFDQARSANPFLFYTWPLILFFIVWNEIKLIKGRKYRADKLIEVLMLLYVIALIVFGIARNIGTVPHFVRIGASLHWLPGIISRYLP